MYLFFGLLGCSITLDLRFVSDPGAATLARELEHLVVDFIAAPILKPVPGFGEVSFSV